MLAKHFVGSLRSQLNHLRYCSERGGLTWCEMIGKYQVGHPLSRSYSGGYYKSRVEESPEKYTAYEKSYDEWKYVEKLMPHAYVPRPPMDPNVDLPSGWKPPNPPKDSPYFIRRTKNHQIPVYEEILDVGNFRRTYIKKIEGDIWAFEKEIGQYLQDLHPETVIEIKTHEIHRHVIIRGVYVDEVKEWLISKGF